MKKNHLHNAKEAKDDEFYTRYSDIENEVEAFKDQFEGKIVYCNCDSEDSNFWKFFCDKFHYLKLKEIIATCYVPRVLFEEHKCYKLSYDGKNVTKTKMKTDGDFVSYEATEILRGCDIVATNPPFSIFRKYFAHLINNNKKFLIIGSVSTMIHSVIVEAFRNDECVPGVTRPKNFIRPDGSIKEVNAMWYTNLDRGDNHDRFLELTKTYTPEDYPTYSNKGFVDVINVDASRNIPKDYYGKMGVPLSFVARFYEPKQFKIVGMLKATMKGNYMFARMIIQRR